MLEQQLVKQSATGKARAEVSSPMAASHVDTRATHAVISLLRAQASSWRALACHRLTAAVAVTSDQTGLQDTQLLEAMVPQRRSEAMAIYSEARRHRARISVLSLRGPPTAGHPEARVTAAVRLLRDKRAAESSAGAMRASLARILDEGSFTCARLQQ